MRILVVEDDRKVASFIRKCLKEEGHAVGVAADSAAAIERATDGAPWDLVVLDVWPQCRQVTDALRPALAQG